MRKRSVISLIFATLSLIVLLVWQVFVGYEEARVAFRSNLELVLRENNSTNGFLLRGYVQRLGDLARAVGDVQVPADNFSYCGAEPGKTCLAGLIARSGEGLYFPSTPNVDCGQRELLRVAAGTTGRTYMIGATTWMPSQMTMAPIAHVFPDGGGWLAACLNMDPIREIWRNLDLPPKTSMALVRATDFHLWIREPFKPTLLGRDLSDGPLVAAMRAQGIDGGGIADITATKTDFVQRTVQWSPIGVDDLILVAGYSKHHFLQTWFKREAVHLTIVSVLVFALIVLGLFSSRNIAGRFREVSDLAQRLSIATSGAEIGIFDYDFRTDRLTWNEQMYRIYGVDPREFGGSFQDWRRAVHPDDLSEAERLFELAHRENNQFRTDFRIVRPDGAEVWIYAVAEFTETDGGLPARVLGVNMDISERVRSQEDLKQLTLRLAAERDKSEQDNKAKTDFMAHMSHEIRTPLNAIVGFTEILQMRFGDSGKLSKEKEYTVDILKAGYHLLSLANEFLDVSRIENTLTEVDIKKYSAVDLIRDAVATSDPLRINGITFSIEVEDEFEVLCDKRSMHQCLLNLITNAIKYSPKYSVIRVGAFTQNGTVNLFVDDCGDGMDEQLIEQIGQPFLRPMGPDVANPKGVGLGLAITKRLIEVQGGRLIIVSRKGVGTRAQLVL